MYLIYTSISGMFCRTVHCALPKICHQVIELSDFQPQVRPSSDRLAGLLEEVNDFFRT